MGLGQSKEKNKFDEDLKPVDMIDIIATKYILTQKKTNMLFEAQILLNNR